MSWTNMLQPPRHWLWRALCLLSLLFISSQGEPSLTVWSPQPYSGEQTPLKPSIAETVNQKISIPFSPLFVARMTIGTPAQEIDVTLDLSWSDLFVPSKQCDRCIRHHKFNYAKSTTYWDLSKEGRLYYPPAAGAFKGTWARDIVSLGTIQAKQVEFLNFDRIEGDWIFYGGYDAVFGLSPFDPDDKQSLRNPLKALASSHELEQNLFSLVPPTYEKDGELLLGAIPEQYSNPSRPFTTMAINPISYQVGSWLANLRSVSFLDTKWQFEGKFIGLSTVFWPILLPQEQYLMFHAAIRGYQCDKLDELPNITIDIGGPRRLVLAASDYMWFSAGACFPYVYHIEGALGEGFEDVAVVLGRVFMKEWMGIFDFGNKEIRCK
ncbi:acid protease [Microthyrium microscopicum]|uniref:Acid protease n=1 Tax=Microthyrium microscopicum TaxID=703497 RepID=A0A6A6U4B4_9PEZI|nr:acid protease [Microthyrium microscopicum]